MGSLQGALQLPCIHIPDVEGSIPRASQNIVSVRAAEATAEQEGEMRDEASSGGNRGGRQRCDPTDRPEHSFRPVRRTLEAISPRDRQQGGSHARP